MAGWSVMSCAPLTQLLVVHKESSRSIGWFDDHGEAAAVCAALNGRQSVPELDLDQAAKDFFNDKDVWPMGAARIPRRAVEGFVLWLRRRLEVP